MVFFSRFFFFLLFSPIDNHSQGLQKRPRVDSLINRNTTEVADAAPEFISVKGGKNDDTDAFFHPSVYGF